MSAHPDNAAEQPSRSAANSGRAFSGTADFQSFNRNPVLPEPPTKRSFAANCDTSSDQFCGDALAPTREKMALSPINWRNVPALLAAAMGTAILLGCGVSGYRLPDYRYRLTVEVETPEGLKTGSSVIEVKTTVAGRNSIPTPGAVNHRVRGQAIAVDLGTRGVLFALLRSDDNSDWASNVMYRMVPKIPRVHDANGRFDSDRDFEAQFAAMLRHRDAIDLPVTFPDQGHLKNQPARPLLVRFRNIADPATVEKVKQDDLAASFGSGVELKRITVQLTDDPVTTGIEKKLGWLPSQRGSLVPVPRGTPIGEMPIGSDLTEGDFLMSPT